MTLYKYVCVGGVRHQQMTMSSDPYTAIVILPSTQVLYESKPYVDPWFKSHIYWGWDGNDTFEITFLENLAGLFEHMTGLYVSKQKKPPAPTVDLALTPPTATPWVATERESTGRVVHLCKHGVGHPVFGSADWMSLVDGSPRGMGSPHRTHVCCDHACCISSLWEWESMKLSVMKANEIIMEHKKVIKDLENTVIFMAAPAVVNTKKGKGKNGNIF